MHKVKAKSKKSAPAPAAVTVNTAVDKEKGKAQAAAIFANPPATGQGFLLDIVNSGAQLPQSVQNIPLKQVRFGTEPNSDIVGDIRDLSYIPSESCAVVWNASSLCYLYAHEVPTVLKEMHRILKKNGVLLLSLPDMQRLGQYAYQGKLEKLLYKSPAGPITTLDLMYGHVASIQRGQLERVNHTAFAANTISRKLTNVGFGDVEVRRETMLLHVTARKVVAVPADKPRVRYMDDDINKVMRVRDEIDKAPEIWTADLSPLKK